MALPPQAALIVCERLVLSSREAAGGLDGFHYSCRICQRVWERQGGRLPTWYNSIDSVRSHSWRKHSLVAVEGGEAAAAAAAAADGDALSSSAGSSHAGEGPEGDMGGAMVEGVAATSAHAPEPPLEAAPIPTSSSDGMDVDASADDDSVDLAASADDMPSLETAPSTSASSSDGMDDEQPDDGAAAELKEAAAAERSPYAPVDLDRLSSWIADNPGAAEHAQELYSRLHMPEGGLQEGDLDVMLDDSEDEEEPAGACRG